MSSPSDQRPARKLGLLGGFGVLIGGGCLLVALVSVFNVAFEWDLALSVYGSDTALPTHWEEVIGLAAAGLILVVLSLFGSQVSHRFREAKGKPLVRVGIIVVAVALLVLVGRGVQVLALTSTYGSMLAYYATDGDLDDVRAELAKDPDREALDRAVSRAAQYDNAAALDLLLEAGADMMQETREYKRCPLAAGVGAQFIEVALKHGVTPATCVDGEAAVYGVVDGDRNGDADTAKAVKLLTDAGWSATAKPEGYDRTPQALAEQRKMPETVAALTAAGG